MLRALLNAGINDISEACTLHTSSDTRSSALFQIMNKEIQNQASHVDERSASYSAFALRNSYALLNSVTCLE